MSENKNELPLTIKKSVIGPCGRWVDILVSSGSGVCDKCNPKAPCHFDYAKDE